MCIITNDALRLAESSTQKVDANAFGVPASDVPAAAGDVPCGLQAP